MIQGKKITEIELVNFQGHVHTILHPHENVSALVGQTGKGKSTVLKAIEWVYNDTIMGESRYGTKIHNHAIVGETNSGAVKLLGNTVVSITWDDGSKITRYKGKDNKYEIQKPGEELLTLTKTGSGAQEQVKELFNFADPNFSTQFEGVYLLFDTPGQIAAKLNELADLTKPDQILKMIRSDLKSTNAEKKVIESDLEEIKLDLSDYEKIPELEDKLKALEEKETKLKTLQEQLSSMETLNEKIEEIDITLSSIKDLDKREEKLNSLLKKEAKYTEISNELVSMKSYMDDLYYLHNELESLKNVEKQEELLLGLLEKAKELEAIKKTEHEMLLLKDSIVDINKQLEKFPDESLEKKLLDLREKRSLLDENEKMITAMTSLFESILTAVREIETVDKNIEELEKELEGISCPTCGKPMSKGDFCE